MREEKYQQEQAEIDRKLTQNSQLFDGLGCGSYEKKPGQDFFHFWGRESGKKYELEIPTNHPALKSVNINDETWRKKHGLYLITGAGNLPLECNFYNGHIFYHKWIELTDKITITPYSG